ncbi:hypothetical protein DAPPUDRAFT_314963 [Daphnia pulex]|uniref:Uncharacterized protein n=1 Tax=Daphnia pulex TaxID=6669 RepID=E9G885_DAPPU|nr:hypothetical protein DAPPUDRAFT_314963 [Daphnia pulex]|eukprot:EFX83933.1 hypothetical protein DAPPUDRAFT_314963 [Daphnia pulex]
MEYKNSDYVRIAGGEYFVQASNQLCWRCGAEPWDYVYIKSIGDIKGSQCTLKRNRRVVPRHLARLLTVRGLMHYCNQDNMSPRVWSSILAKPNRRD